MSKIQKVLVVDNNSVYAEMVAEGLRRIGIEAFIACTPTEALGIATAHCLDMVILDETMRDIAEALRRVSTSPHFRIKVLTYPSDLIGKAYGFEF